tara:strand:+ start:654 stop:1289 length:636 start_codon:yes stop_codon:yes gene_type:complete
MATSQTEFLQLWPTLLVKRQLGEFAEPTRDLLKLVREMDRNNKKLTTEYINQNPLDLDHSGANWLRSQINELVIDYLRSLGIDYPVDWQIHAWANINRKGDYHDSHNHPHSYLSGTYYLKVPEKRRYAKNRSDVRPNNITFYDPRPGVNMLSIKNDATVDPELTIYPEPGLLVVWPGFLHHFVHPNLSDETRISISFNIVLKWHDHYLPDQ